MDLKTRYLGLELKNPFVLGASPLGHDLDSVRRAEDAGVSALVMNSLFEEQLTLEALAHHRHSENHAESFAEATSWLPPTPGFALGPEEYLEQIRRSKQALSIPVMGSLNGITAEGWLGYAKLIQSAGADALELNVFELATDPLESAENIESRVLEMVRTVKSELSIPLSVKLSPFYTALPHFAQRLAEAGAQGLVLFNRFYQPDIDVEELEVTHKLRLSTPSELNLRLHYLAILHGHVPVSLAITGGVHDHLDAVKAVMTGASAVQMVSAILQKGPEHFRGVVGDFERFLVEHEYESVSQMLGSMNLLRCPDPRAYARANYVQLLQSWREPAFLLAAPAIRRGTS